MKRTCVLSTVALLLSACGGGGSDSPSPTAVSANPQAPAPAPSSSPAPVTAPAPAQPAPAPQAPVATAPIAVAAPVTAPVDPNPAPAPAQSPPPAGSPPAAAPTTPVPPPQPAAGTFVLGSVVKKAIQTQPNQEFVGVEVNKEGNPVAGGLEVRVGYFAGPAFYGQSSYVPNDFGLPKYPYGSTSFPVDYTNEGFLALGRTMIATSYVRGPNGQYQSRETALVRPEGAFEIPDDFKFIIDTTAAEWRGVEGAREAFVQLQIASYARSNTVFALCQHQYFGDVRRRACTLHNKDTGQYRGVSVIDDSRNIGQIEYLPRQ